MADNLTTQSTTPATVPSGSQIATDDVAGVHYQRVKLVDGTLDGTAAIPGDAANGLDVDVTRVQGTVSVNDAGGSLTVDDGGGSLTVDGTVSVSGTVTTNGTVTGSGTAGLPSAGVVTVQGIASGTPQPVSGTVSVGGTVTVDGSGVTQPVKIDQTGTNNQVALTAAQVATLTPPAAITGFATSAKQDTGNTSLNNIDGKLPALSGGSVPVTLGGATLTVNAHNVTQVPATSGGLTPYRALWGASTFPSAQPKSTAGQVFGWVITNTSASVRYVKFYSLAGTNPTLASDVPKLTIMVPGNTSGAGVVAAEFVNGIAFASGISLAVTTGIADTDTTAPGANEVIVNLMYK